MSYFDFLKSRGNWLIKHRTTILVVVSYCFATVGFFAINPVYGYLWMIGSLLLCIERYEYRSWKRIYGNRYENIRKVATKEDI